MQEDWFGRIGGEAAAGVASGAGEGIARERVVVVKASKSGRRVGRVYILLVVVCVVVWWFGCVAVASSLVRVLCEFWYGFKERKDFDRVVWMNGFIVC